MHNFDKLLEKSEEGFDIRCKYYKDNGLEDLRFAEWNVGNGTVLQRGDVDFTCVLKGRNLSCSEKIRYGKYYGDVLIEMWSMYEDRKRGWLEDSIADIIFMWWPDGTVLRVSPNQLKTVYAEMKNKEIDSLFSELVFDSNNKAKSIRRKINILDKEVEATIIGARTLKNGKMWTTYSVALSIEALESVGVHPKVDTFLPENKEPEVNYRELNKIYNVDCREGLRGLADNSVDLTVTSPPYDNLRSYGDTLEWNDSIFQSIARQLYRVTKPGGVVVWVVGDAVLNGSESGTSFKQALYFKEIGFKIHDTMIYEKNSSSFPARSDSKRYSQIFEYMFVFVKGKIRDDIKLIADKKNKWAGWTTWGSVTNYNQKGDLKKVGEGIKPVPEFSLRTNIWKYSVGGFNDKAKHPAVFPEKLAEDHILSWSNVGDVVLDPFMGSGTTAKMAVLHGRKFIGFEKNEEYWKESVERVGKYLNSRAEDLKAVNYENEEIQYAEDPEENEKTELWNSLHKQLEDYFNEQQIETLRLLKLSFESKSNEKRLQKLSKD